MGRFVGQVNPETSDTSTSPRCGLSPHNSSMRMSCVALNCILQNAGEPGGPLLERQAVVLGIFGAGQMLYTDQ